MCKSRRAIRAAAAGATALSWLVFFSGVAEADQGPINTIQRRAELASNARSGGYSAASGAVNAQAGSAPSEKKTDQPQLRDFAHKYELNGKLHLGDW